MVVYPSKSKYTSIITVTDDVGDPVNLRNADTVEYIITSRKGTGEELYRTNRDSDPDFTVRENDGEFNIVEIFIEANEVTWSGTVWEELRVRFDEDQSTIVFQDPVLFNDVISNP